MSEITTVGSNLAKDVLQVHGVDARGGVVFRKKLRSWTPPETSL